jgi:hypothetical protein
MLEIPRRGLCLGVLANLPYILRWGIDALEPEVSKWGGSHSMAA